MFLSFALRGAKNPVPARNQSFATLHQRRDRLGGLLHEYYKTAV
jgi:hypothetical protein